MSSWPANPFRSNEASLRGAIAWGARTIKKQIHHGIDPVALFAAIAEVESSFGRFNVPRPEVSFSPGGKFYNDDQKARYFKWGALACSSWSSFQIMHPVACELGYNPDRSPLDLWDDLVAVQWVVEYIRKRTMPFRNVAEFADAYNSGNNKDPFVPHGYIKKFEAAYKTVRARRGI